MNQHDVSGLLKTYAEKAMRARSSEHLREIVRELKRELSAAEIKRMKVER